MPVAFPGGGEPCREEQPHREVERTAGVQSSPDPEPGVSAESDE